MKPNSRNSLRPETVVSFVVAVALVTGCASVRKKFIRKKKAEMKEGVVYRPVEPTGPTLPHETRYVQHLAYWRSWEQEWIDVLDQEIQNPKKLKQVALQAVEELKSMQRYLADEHQAKLDPFIRELEQLQTQAMAGPLTYVQAKTLQARLQRHRLAVEKQFQLGDVKGWIRPDVSEAQQPAASP